MMFSRHSRLGAGLTLLLTAALSAQDRPSADQPAVVVDGQPVTRAQVLGNLEQRMGAAQMETAILSALILAEAAKAQLTPTDAEVDAWLVWLKQEQFHLSEERWRAWLAEYGKDEPTLRAELKVQAAQWKLRSRAARYGEQDLRRYWEQHRAEYGRPESFVFRQIIVPRPQAARDPEQAALAAATRLLERIRAGEDFERTARETSEDPDGARTGGLIGPAPVELLRGTAAQIAALLPTLKDGEVAPKPVLQGERYHLIQRVQHLPAVSGAFDTVRVRVMIEFLIESGKVQPQVEFIAGLLRGRSIEIKDPRYRGLKLRGRWLGPSGLVLPGWLQDQ